jgi:hypothetical protein
LIGDVPALFLVAIILAVLIPRTKQTWAWQVWVQLFAQGCTDPATPHGSAYWGAPAAPKRTGGWSARPSLTQAVWKLPMDNKRNQARSWWYLLLLLQFVPALWVPFYNSVEPSFAGIPFFYWFQLALVFASAAVTAVVYLATE